MPFEKIKFYSQRLADCLRLRQSLKQITYRGNNTGTIVFNAVGCYVPDVQPEHYLAYLMACDGYQVKILMDDFQLTHWDYMLKVKSDDDYKFHKTLKNRALRGGHGVLSNMVFSHPNIEIIHYSAIFKKIPDQVTLIKSDLNHAESSTRKYFQSGEVDFNDPVQKNYYEICVQNCRASKRVALYVEKFLKPDLYVHSHGFYSVWGPANDYLKSKGFKVLVYSVSPYRGQQLLIYDTTIHFITQDHTWRKFREHTLTPLEKKSVDEYFAQRFNGRAYDTNIYYKNIESYAKRGVDNKTAKYTFALFPNIIWDGDVIERNTLFKGPVEWICETVKFFEKNPHLHLILRFHPAEATFHTTSKKLESIIRERIPALDQIKNISVISSHEKVNTYDFIKDTVDVGLVFDGMIGLEMPYMGKPVILSAQSRLSGANVGYEPKSVQEYLGLLSDPQKLLEDFKNGPYRENLYKYAYWYLFQQCYKLPVLSPTNVGRVKYCKDPKELDPVYDPEILKTVQYISDCANLEIP